MPDRASCKHLTHKYASFFGCTIEEVCIMAVIYLILDIICAVILSIFFGMFFIFFIGFFICSYFLVRFTARKLGTFKENKQQGYPLLKLKQKLNQTIGLSVPFITQKTAWSARRRI